MKIESSQFGQEDLSTFYSLKKKITILLFFIIIVLSFFHSFTFFDYNSILIVILLYLWMIQNESRIFVFFILLATIPIDFLLITFFSKTFILKREFIFKPVSFTQSIQYSFYVKISFSFSIIVKIFLVIWILITKKNIQNKMNSTYFTSWLQKTFSLF